MKKVLVFIMALALLMLVAIPATAGPVYVLPTIENAIPSILTTAAKASVLPAMNPLYVSSESSPAIMRNSLARLNLEIATAISTRYRFAVLATLAALTCGVMIASMATSGRRLKYDIRDRMHGLPRDQDALA